MQRAAREVDKVTQAEAKRVDVEKRATVATTATRKSVEDLTKGYDAYTKKLKSGTDDHEIAIKQLNRFSQEFEALAKKAGPAGSAASEDMLKFSRSAKTLAKDIDDAYKKRAKQVDDAYRQAAQVEQAYKDLDRVRAEAAKKAADEEARASDRRKAFALDVLGAAYEDEAKRSKDRVAIIESEQKDRERLTNARIQMERDLAANEERRATTQQQSIAKTVAALDSEGRAARRQLEEHVRLRREIEDSTTAYDKFAASVRRGEVSGTQARVGLAQHAQVLSTRARQATTTFGAGSPDALFAGTRETEARGLIRSIGRDAERATPQVGGLMGALRSLFSIDPERARSIDTMLEGIENKLAAASYNAVHFAGTLRALIYVGVIVFFGQLVSGVIALAGALTAVASTAIQAGGALGGALAAGAAQAIPVVGLLAAAWGRVGAVFKAVQQNIKQHLQATKESSDAANRQRDAANRVADAQERVRDSQRSLVDANQRYTDSQENLNRALKEGQRQWEDIVAAERSAELQAERSVLSQTSAQEALAQAIRSGDASSVADLSLRVREADEAVGSARTNLQRSRQDAAEARRTGPGGLPSVVAARRQVRDAREGVGDAGRNVQKAREDLKGARQDAEDAVKKLSAADQTLQNMLADLSPAERRLYEVLNRVVTRYRQVFTGPGGVLESIIDSFTFGAGRVLSLLNDDRLIGAARRLAVSISTELRRIFSFLTNTDQRSFIVEMADDARRNLPIITTFAEQVVKIFEALARAGGPALTRFLDFLTTMATRAALATGRDSGLDRLTQFFLKGEEYAEDIAGLAEALLGLFGAIVGSSAKSGQGVIKSITDGVREATTWINDHKREVQTFFSDAIRASMAIAGALAATARALFGLFNADQVVAFSNAFTRTFLPAMTMVLDVLGRVVHVLLSLAGSGPGSVLAQFALVGFGLNKTLTPMVKLFAELGVNIGRILQSKALVGFFGSLLTKLGPIGVAVGIVGGAFLILNSKLHLVDKFKNIFVDAQDRARLAADKFTDAINKQVEALRRQQDAEDRRKGARYALARAEIAVERAQQDRDRVEQQISSGQLKGRDADLARREASLGIKQALLDEKQARKDLASAKNDENKADQGAVNQSKTTLDTARQRITALKDERDELTKRRDRLEEFVKREKHAVDVAVDGSVQQQKAQQDLRRDQKLLADTNDDLRKNEGNLRDEGKKSINAFHNWQKAVKAAGKSTVTFSDVVHDTMDSIVSDVNDVLVEFGAKPLKWHSRRKKTSVESESGATGVFGVPDIGGFPGRQHGGVGLTVPGHGTGDSVYAQAKVEPGEKLFVLNRNASRVLDGLHSLNRMIPRFAAGGEINWNHHPTNVNASVKAMLSKIFGRWPEMVVTATTDHSPLTTSGRPSDHVYGNAVDIGSSDYAYMNRVAEWVKSSGLYRSLKQGIHNPNLAVNAGRIQKPPGIFAGHTWTEHLNHIHLAITGALGKLSGGAGDVAARLISGPPGALTNLFSGITRKVVRAANRFLATQSADTASDTALAGTDSTYVGPLDRVFPRHLTGTPGARLSLSSIFKLLRSVGLPRWFEKIIHGESDYEPGVVQRNPGDNNVGVGLAQLTPHAWDANLPAEPNIDQLRRSPSLLAQKMAKLGGFGQMRNPVKNLEMAKYLLDHALSKVPNTRGFPWFGTRYLATGGEVMGRLGQAVPIVAHAKEWVLNQFQQGKVASWLGTSISGLKGALGFGGDSKAAYKDGGEVKPYTVPATLGTGEGEILRELGRAGKVVAGLRSSLINSKFTDALSKSFGAIVGQGGLLDMLSDAVGALTNKLDVNLKRATFKVTKSGDVIRRLTDDDVAGRTVENLERVYASLAKEQRTIQTELDGVNRRLRSKGLDATERTSLRGLAKNLGDRLTTIRSSIADNLQSRFDTIEAAIQGHASDAQDRATRRLGTVDLKARARAVAGSGAATLLGLPSPEQLANQRAGILRSQAIDVGNAAREATRAGHGELATTLKAQVADLLQQAIEAVGQGLRDAETEIEAVGARRATQIALAGRVADLRERLGDVAGAFALRGANLADTRTNTLGQIGSLTALLGRAQAAGQTAVAEELIDKIAELNQQLAENEVAIKENTVAARTAAITAITQRQGFLGGVFSGVTGIVNSLGEASGVTDTGTLRTILQRAGNTLRETGAGLLQKLVEGFGIDLRGQSPQQIVQSLLGLNYDSIEAGMLPVERQQFEDLINSIIDNTATTVDNTKQLNDLNSQTAQSFSSGFWQMFRRAIFNGVGGLNPQFSVALPSLATSTSGIGSSIYSGNHSIVGAQVVPSGGGGDTTIINSNITTPTVVRDPVDEARQLAFSYKNRVKR